MKKFEDDKQLENLLKKTRLESPSQNFTTNVMNVVIQEVELKTQTKRKRFLGRSFWIFIFMFIAIIFLLSVLPTTSQSTFGLGKLFSTIDSGSISNEYQSLINKFSDLPVGFSGILFGISFLLFFERFLSTRLKLV